MAEGIVASRPPSKRDRFLASRFGAALTGASDDWLLTIVLTFVVAKGLSIVIGLLTLIVDPASINDFSGHYTEIDGKLLFGGIILAPLFESGVVWISIFLLDGILRFRKDVTVLLAGLIHVPLHGMVIHSFIIAPFFVLNAMICKNYRDRGRSLAGCVVLVGAHALFNGVSLWLALLI